MTASRIPVALAVLLLASCRSGKQADAYGNMEATEVVVGSQATGQLENFRVAEGNRVAAGEIVALVDATALQLQLQQTMAQRTASASRVDEVTKQAGVFESQLVIARRAYERMKRLFEQQAATAQQLDQAERDYRTLVAQIEAAHAQRNSVGHDVSAADARVAQIRDQIRKSQVTNPLTGTVLVTYTKTGEFVQTGQPLYKVASLDTMELRAYVTEPQLANVKVGQRVEVSVDVAGSDRRVVAGRVSWISSQAEFTPTPIETRDQRSNLVYAIKVRVPNPAGLLKIGMPADLRLSPRTATK